ncbi:aldehyde dehydrogenase, partial [Phocaeicola coprophilus]|nr:aldehyde dehydrogenase [Phocaeicola coprophilus]
YEYRYEQLTKLKNAVLKYETALTLALQKDLGKSKLESYTTEIGFVLHSISNAQNNLKKWVKPQKVKTPWYLFPAKSYIN